ncbi:TolC family protein [Vibrio sp. JC009]|uniref:TolC family protein n=1 Tax=Vibrio sp. JC009 TaxID=2912314 RepID=UPI0023AFF26F|nr:TolC family protein [Vibrio sp. JC009]WED23763.1 TolC family protein [Vibrio sp. JC009]
MTFKYSILSLMLVGLIGCSSTSDLQYSEQATDTTNQTSITLVEKYISEHQQASDATEEPLLITDLVNIPELSQYIETALESSPSLQQSISALKILYAQKGYTDSDRIPSVDATFKAQDEEDSDETYTGDLTVSWELDLWSKISADVAAADKDIANSQASLQETQDVLVANIMQAWLKISLNQQLVEIEKRRLSAYKNNETLVLERYRAGLGSLEDLDNAKTNSSSTLSTLAEYEENLEQSKRDLILLTGQWSGEEQQLNIPSQFPDVLNPLSEMSDQTLARRPDLKAAFYSIEAESLRTESAYKALLPSISLSASLTDAATSPSEALFTNPLWSLLGQVSAPIFQGGKLRASAKMQELTTEKAFWEYQDTLLTAVNEVEDAIGQEYALTKQQDHLGDAYESALRSFNTYEEKYRQGLVDILDLLTIQQQTYDKEAQLVNATYNRLVNRIDLGLALGLGTKA